MAIVIRFDECSSLPHIHVSAATCPKQFEFVHGFPAQVSLNSGLPISRPFVVSTVHKEAKDLARQITNQHKAAFASTVAGSCSGRSGEIIDRLHKSI